jgi:hypothetical protein
MENRNRKRKFIVLGRQMINNNRELLSQQTCPSMYVGQLCVCMMRETGLGHKDATYCTMYGSSTGSAYSSPTVPLEDPAAAALRRVYLYRAVLYTQPDGSLFYIEIFSD